MDPNGPVDAALVNGEGAGPVVTPNGEGVGAEGPPNILAGVPNGEEPAAGTVFVANGLATVAPNPCPNVVEVVFALEVCMPKGDEFC